MALGLALGMYISYFLCRFHLRLVPNANPISSGIWALHKLIIKSNDGTYSKSQNSSYYRVPLLHRENKSVLHMKLPHISEIGTGQISSRTERTLAICKYNLSEDPLIINKIVPVNTLCIHTLCRPLKTFISTPAEF